jgi:hypothetical protein
MTEEHLTLEERAYNFETMRHIERVRDLLGFIIRELTFRAAKHDQSKLEQPEVGILSKARPLAEMVYDSKEFHESKKTVQKALDNHYANNRHHPEHFADGINDMSLVDLIEMCIDWKASSERHPGGNLLKSIEINRGRFKMSDQLARIFNNTAHILDEE